MSVTIDILSPGELALDAGGARLVQGPPGEAATVEIGAVTKGDAASVTNIGSATHAVLDFVLPKGDTGEQGPQGAAGETGPRGATFTPALDAEGVLSWTNDGGFANPAPVSVRGPRGPQGEKGDTGDAGPQGPAGADGGYYQPGISAEGLLTWTPSRGGMPAVSAASVIGPRGEKGETGAQGPAGADGAPGAAATVAVGTVTTGAAGSTASVVNAGTASAAVLNFVIPRGDKGETGAQGPAGADGADGAQGPAGAAGKSAYQYALEAGYTGTEAELSAALAGLGDINGVLDAINGEVV